MSTLAYLCYLAVIPLIFILLALCTMALWTYLKYLTLSQDLKESYDRKKEWKIILTVIKWMLIFLALYNGYWMLLGKLILATE